MALAEQAAKVRLHAAKEICSHPVGDSAATGARCAGRCGALSRDVARQCIELERDPWSRWYFVLCSLTQLI